MKLDKWICALGLILAWVMMSSASAREPNLPDKTEVMNGDRKNTGRSLTEKKTVKQSRQKAENAAPLRETSQKSLGLGCASSED